MGLQVQVLLTRHFSKPRVEGLNSSIFKVKSQRKWK
nr:MAG TPA: hypothetical protein [Caudoviricetes sp.]